MGKFFANQKLDEAGVIGITLQKLLIFFMVLDAATLFCGYSFFSSFMSLLLHFVVFMGVYRRRTCVLLVYVVFHVAVFILAAFALILVVSSVMYMQPNYQGDGYGSDGLSGSDATHNGTYTYVRSLRNIFGQNHHNHTEESSSSAYFSSDSMWSTSSEEPMVADFFLLSIVLLLFSIIILYCKILSVVLAHKMRKLLLAPTVLPVANTESEVNPAAFEFEPTYIPADFENNVPLFAQSGFAYQPMQQQPMYPGQSPMMPAPFMYGQHPVFYSYGPAPTKDNEKI